MTVPPATGPPGEAGDRARFPGPGERWRCGGCGNLTRFDVVHADRIREFWHVGLSGEGSVEETTVLAETVESVTCRWCGRADAIQYVPRAGSGES
jgi:ribosomal protein S27E